METMTITLELTPELARELQPYQDDLVAVIQVGLRQIKMQTMLALYQKGTISLWKAARMAGVSLREMIEFAAAQGIQPDCDEETIAEELACLS